MADNAGKLQSNAKKAIGNEGRESGSNIMD